MESLMPSARPSAIALVLVLLGSTTAQAGDLAKARMAFEGGQTAYNAGDYKMAFRYFETAYHESHRVSLLWNMASALRKQFDVDHDIEHLKKARTFYESFCQLSPSRKEVEEGLREAETINTIIRTLESAGYAGVQPRAGESQQIRETSLVDEGEVSKTTPVYRRWWFWTLIVGVVAVGAGVGLGVGLSTPQNAPTPSANAGTYTLRF
jgi:hypothetical protein